MDLGGAAYKHKCHMCILDKQNSQTARVERTIALKNRAGVGALVVHILLNLELCIGINIF